MQGIAKPISWHDNYFPFADFLRSLFFGIPVIKPAFFFNTKSL